MNKIKSTLGAAGASLAIVMGMAGVAAADATSITVCTSDGRVVAAAGDCGSSATDSSRTYTVNGNCSGIFQIYSVQSNDNGTAQVAVAPAVNTSTQTSGLAADSSNSGTSASNVSQVNGTVQGNTLTLAFTPNCSTTNVTNVTQQVAAAPAAAASAAPAASASVSAASQVVAPTGGVHAGGGAGVTTSGIPAIAGLTGSLASVGLGLVLRKKALLEL